MRGICICIHPKIFVRGYWRISGAYAINLNDVPTGNGTYQQLITINNPSDYNINSKGSNIQFTSSNGTLLYAWLQNINSTTMQVWIKNYNSSSTIIMQVFPSFENLFNANGYLGEAPQLSTTYAQYDNGISVFGEGKYYDFTSSSQLSGWTDNGINYSISDGLIIYGDTSDLSALYNSSTSFVAGQGVGIIGNIYEPNDHYWTLTGVRGFAVARDRDEFW